MEDKDKDKRIPDKPPFTAYIANLPYDVDEGEVKEVFEKAEGEVQGVRGPGEGGESDSQPAEAHLAPPPQRV